MDSNLDFLNWPTFDLEQRDKEKFLEEKLHNLTSFHYENCSEYKKIIKNRKYNFNIKNSIGEIPWIPVRLFKHYDLKSIKKEEIYKILFSSGTTNQKPSSIYLDKSTSKIQSKILVKILQNFIGKKRLPMLIIDSPSTVKNKNSFSARAAGILGLSNFGHSHCYVLRDDMTLDFEKLEDFSSKFMNEPKLIFGFTFMVWKYFIKQLEIYKNKINLSQSILFHSGGWKKLQSEAVSNEVFKKKLEDLTSIKKIHNFYGMVEQVGSIFVECEYGYLHAPSYSDIIIRDSIDFRLLENNKSGLIQVVSSLPHSYPGHSLLTEDIGRILGVDNCKCGRKGKYFEIHGRLVNSENRGCSDTFSNV